MVCFRKHAKYDERKDEEGKGNPKNTDREVQQRLVLVFLSTVTYCTFSPTFMASYH
jgi:hypothetical protein